VVLCIKTTTNKNDDNREQKSINNYQHDHQTGNITFSFPKQTNRGKKIVELIGQSKRIGEKK
jgi:hypothetical protein